jgi:hypothetical protein
MQGEFGKSWTLLILSIFLLFLEKLTKNKIHWQYQHPFSIQIILKIAIPFRSKKI